MLLSLIPYLVFFTLLGLCVGSFLNVVIYRLPLGKSLVHPPSTCPQCNTRLAWYDNIPVLGWLKLKGKCRWCQNPISLRYPIVEAAVGGLFLFHTLALFLWNLGPCVPQMGPLFSSIGLPVAPPLPDITRDWPILLMHLALIGMLFAASAIDFETFTIPASLPLFAAIVGLAGHSLLMTRTTMGSLHLSPSLALAAAGALGGYLLTLTLFHLRVIPLSFPNGEPMMLDRSEWEAEIAAAKAENREPNVPLTPPIAWTRAMLTREIFKEVLFCLLPLAGFVLGLYLSNNTSFGKEWSAWLSENVYVSGLLGSALGALVGGGFIWIFRILGTLGFGKLAMGLGDVHLMAAVGAVTGGTVACSALFVGAIWGLAFTLYTFITRKQREFPFGPYLAMGTYTCLLAACPLYQTLANVWTNITTGP